MTTIISFDRDRIKANIHADNPSPPIQIYDGKSNFWTNGVKLSGKADILYRAHEKPSLFIKTASRVTRSKKTVDQPCKDRNSSYIYIQLSWLQINKKCPDDPQLPVLTRHFFQDRNGWKSECCYGLRIDGESMFEYSLGKTLHGKKTGVRLWVRTEADVTPIDSRWYRSTLHECRRELEASGAMSSLGSPAVRKSPKNRPRKRGTLKKSRD